MFRSRKKCWEFSPGDLVCKNRDLWADVETSYINAWSRCNFDFDSNIDLNGVRQFGAMMAGERICDIWACTVIDPQVCRTFIDVNRISAATVIPEYEVMLVIVVKTGQVCYVWSDDCEPLETSTEPLPRKPFA